MDKCAVTIMTNVNREFELCGKWWRVDEEGDLLVVFDGVGYVIDYVIEPTWTVWQDTDTIDDFAVTITSDHVARAEGLLEALAG